MSCLIPAIRNHFRIKIHRNQKHLQTLENPHGTNRIPRVHQIRFKNSTRQTGGGKSSSGKSSENRSAQTKGYLKKSKAGAGSADGKSDRYDVIRQMLYGEDEQMTDPARLRRLIETVPDYQIHETIDRAWKLHERHQRDRQRDQLEKQYLSMNNALEQLRLADLKLYLNVVKDENGSIHRLQNIVQKNPDENININSTGKLIGLFPRQIRLPTESLPSSDKVWDHDWKNPVNPLT